MNDTCNTGKTAMGRIKIDEKTAEKLSPIIVSYYDDIRESIAKRLFVMVKEIDSHQITDMVKHVGAGGQTFIIQTEFIAGSRKISGGIVFKFPKEDLKIEIENANTLEAVLKKRQKQWMKNIQSHQQSDYVSQFPQFVFAPKILGIHESIGCVVLEFLSNYTPLLGNKQFSEAFLLQLLGYSLGRLHGSKTYPPAMQLYDPLFRYLQQVNIDKEVTEYWKSILTCSQGGVQVIHGDSHLENILYIKPEAIAMIDALLIPLGERMDDVGYAISHIVQVSVERMVRKFPSMSEEQIVVQSIRHLLEKEVPYVLSAYMKTASITSLYTDEIPIDFFLGTHLIIRADLWDGKVKNVLYKLGKIFLYEKRINKMIKK